MEHHKNARLTPRSRAEPVRRVLVENLASKLSPPLFGLTVKTVNKWVERCQAEGLNRLVDRSTRAPSAAPSRRRTPPSSGLRRCGGSAGPATRSRRAIIVRMKLP
jgi:hypothetical protein